MSTAGLTTPAPDEGAPRGALHAPHEAQAVDSLVTQRTVRVPLELVPDALWVDLRRLAYQCAAFGNHLLSASYVAAKGGPTLPAYTDARGDLAAAVRDAVSRECVGLWRRLGKKILRGEQTLARFSADRALVVRDRGVRLLRDEAGAYVVTLRVLPQAAGDVTPLAVWMPAVRKDRWLADLLAALADGIWPVTKATVQFERPGRKVFVRLTYAKPIERDTAPKGQATLGPLDADGALWIRADGRAQSFTDRVYHLRVMKAHYQGIHARLRRALGKRGRHQNHRRALVRAGSFTVWAEGPLHQFSREIVAFCQREACGTLLWAVVADLSLPWDRLLEMVGYKAQEVGIVVSQVQPPAAQDEVLRSEDGTGAAEPRTKSRGRKRLQVEGHEGVE